MINISKREITSITSITSILEHPLTENKVDLVLLAC